MLSVNWKTASERFLSQSHPKYAARACSACKVVCSYTSSRAANNSRISIKSRNYNWDRDRNQLTRAAPFPKKVGIPPAWNANSRFYTDSRSMAAWLDAELQTAWQAEHDLAAHFRCDGDKNLTNAVFQFTDIVIHLHGQFHHVRALKIQEGIDISPVFLTELFVSDVRAFFGSQISPLCSYVGRMLMTLIFTRVMLRFIGFLMLVCPYSSDFNHPS